MIFRDMNSVFELVPPILFDGIKNRDLPPEQQLVIKVRGVTLIDKEQIAIQDSIESETLNLDKRLDSRKQRMRDLIGKKVVEIRNFEVANEAGGSRQVTEFEEFCRVAPPELVDWLYAVVMSGESLSVNDRKNLSRGSATPSA